MMVKTLLNFGLVLRLLTYVCGEIQNHDSVTCPESVQITCKTSTTVTLTWKPKSHNGHKRMFVVFMSGIDKVWRDVGQFSTTTTSGLIPKLEEDTYYAFRVLCVDVSSSVDSLKSYAEQDRCLNTQETRTEPAEKRSHRLKRIVYLCVILGFAYLFYKMCF